MSDREVVSAAEAADYLVEYIDSYRAEYARFTARSPEGAGYPPLATSPLLGGALFTCYLSPDGYALADEGGAPPYDWWIAGGPTLLVDTEPSSTPPAVTELLAAQGLLGKNMGIYRLVPEAKLTIEDWTGALPQPVAVEERTTEDVVVRVKQYELPHRDVISRLTFGALVKAIDPHLPSDGGPFWEAHKIRNIGFAPATRKHRRWFSLLELSPHVSRAAWDARALRTRINVDVRRDFVHAVGFAERDGGTFEIPGEASRPPLDLVHDRLATLGAAIDSFAELLTSRPDDEERVLHEFLADNPILLDVYGSVVSKPRFVYPEGSSPLGKAYVEPDFLITYPAQRYRLVELERPRKEWATKRGEPRAGVTQSAFQIGEWKDFINNHYDLLRSDYPGISSGPYTTVVIGRSTESLPSDCDLPRYQALVRQQFAVDEVITYDDLLERARTAYVQIAAMSAPVASS